jgi:hypothetical protein
MVIFSSMFYVQFIRVLKGAHASCSQTSSCYNKDKKKVSPSFLEII